MGVPTPETLDAFNAVKTALEVLIIGALMAEEWTRKVLPNASVSVTFNDQGLPSRVDLGYKDRVPRSEQT